MGASQTLRKEPEPRFDAAGVWRRLLIGAILVLGLCGFEDKPPTTADPRADQRTRDTLLYLSQIYRRQNHKIITGHYIATAACCSAKEIGAAGAQYNGASLTAATGQVPGLAGFDYNDHNDVSPGKPVDYTVLNGIIVSYAKAGSLITIGYHGNNPWTGGKWNDAHCPGTFTDLVDPAKPVSAVWKSQLDRVAAGLQALQAAGVTVLWRPLMEMNGTFMWWGACRPTEAQFRTVWKVMFDDFTKVKGLHNLLWVFSQNGGTPEPVFYPGSDVVDVMGFDDYHDAITWPGYADWLRYGKPLAYTERGPHETDGTSQVYADLVPGILRNGWRVSFFQAWFAERGVAFNPGGAALMNDLQVANQPDVKAVMTCMAQATAAADKTACILR